MYNKKPPQHHISHWHHTKRFGYGLFPVRSPLLRESLLVSFPPLTDMLKFSGYSRLIRVQVYRVKKEKLITFFKCQSLSSQIFTVIQHNIKCVSNSHRLDTNKSVHSITNILTDRAQLIKPRPKQSVSHLYSSSQCGNNNLRLDQQKHNQY